MAVTPHLYNNFLIHALQGDVDLDTATVKAAVLDDGYSPDHDADEYWDDVSAHEASADDYTAGGAEITAVAPSLDTGNNRIYITGDDLADEWTPAAPTGRYVVFYIDTGTPATSILIGYNDLGANTSLTGVDVDANGIGSITMS